MDNRTVQRDPPKRLGMPVGLLKYNGNILSGPFYSNRPLLCIDYDNNISIQSVTGGVMPQGTGTLDQAYMWRDEEEKYSGYRAVLEAGPFLIKKGEISIDLKMEGWEDASAREMQAAPIEMTDLRTMRSSVAISESGDIYLTTVHGRVPESVGMTHLETISRRIFGRNLTAFKKQIRNSLYYKELRIMLCGSPPGFHMLSSLRIHQIKTPESPCL